MLAFLFPIRPYLYTPVLDDGTYGYQRINVESQRADPDSMLNRMREMIAVRRKHPALRRGGVHFLEPANPATLAYLRSHGDETILVVSNLSAEPQVAELDLETLAGVRPADLFTEEKLPPVEAVPYRVELNGYQYCWLRC